MTKKHSREFLEAFVKVAQEFVPTWMFQSIHDAARPSAGGKAAHHRIDVPVGLEKVALTELRPRLIRKLPDEELRLAWLRLSQWYGSAVRRKEPVEDFVNAGVWVGDEMDRRGFAVDDKSPLGMAVADFAKEIKGRRQEVHGVKGKLPQRLEVMLEGQPEEILLVRDFVSVVGSAAVAEEPDDMDVCIRSRFDHDLDGYVIDGANLHVALRRFLDPEKKGLHFIDSPTGSFTDYVPMFDLVARRREPAVQRIESEPPDYAGKGRVIKAGSPAQQASAARAEREDKVVAGEFFPQPKPTRPAQEEEEQTVDNLLKLVRDRREDFLPALVQKKYDGARHQVHRVGEKVVIYSEDGDDNTERLPGVVEAIKKLRGGDIVLDAEIERWAGSQHLPRETVSGFLSAKEGKDEDLVVNVFDLLVLDGEDLHKEPVEMRGDKLAGLGVEQSTTGVPDLSKRLNLAPSVRVETVAQLRREVERIRRLPGSEGAVMKRVGSSYPLKATTPTDEWMKFHNASTVRGVVIGGKDTAGGASVYRWGVLAGGIKATTERVGRSNVVPVGESFSTSREFKPGDPIMLEVETLNVATSKDGTAVTAWVPRVLGPGSSTIDTVKSAARRAAENLVLQAKVDEDGEVTYLPPNIMKAGKVVPVVGPAGAPVLFVGGMATADDVKAGKAFAGRDGELLEQVYLRPLGLGVDEVGFGLAVPVITGRDPTVEDVKAWRGHLRGEIERIHPRMVIAFGEIAQASLGDLATMTLPHPSLAARVDHRESATSGIRRMLRRLGGVRKAELGEEGAEQTRGELAVKNWHDRWSEMLPRGGKGRFVYQHHWRGLGEDETKLSDPDLFKTSHSIHGDLRLQGPDGLWGWAVLLGRAQDNREKDGDKLIDWTKGDAIELAPKLQQPLEWLDVGKRRPLITGPGEIGATSGTYSKFFAIDSGTYELGMAREHMVEVFLGGQRLKGRYILTFAPVAGRRRWLIDRPEDQQPAIETRDKAEVIREVRRRGQTVLVWSEPGKTPEFIDVKTGRLLKDLEATIVKADDERRVTVGVVLDPYRIDKEGDLVSPKDVETTAHGWMEKSRVVGLRHSKVSEGSVPVESYLVHYPSTEDYRNAMAGKPHRIYKFVVGKDKEVHSGSWILGVKHGPEVWAMFRRGELNAYSIGGSGIRQQAKGLDPMANVREVISIDGAELRSGGGQPGAKR